MFAFAFELASHKVIKHRLVLTRRLIGADVGSLAAARLLVLDQLFQVLLIQEDMRLLGATVEPAPLRGAILVLVPAGALMEFSTGGTSLEGLITFAIASTGPSIVVVVVVGAFALLFLPGELVGGPVTRTSLLLVLLDFLFQLSSFIEAFEALFALVQAFEQVRLLALLEHGDMHF